MTEQVFKKDHLFYIDEVRPLINSLLKEEITMSRYVEILNEKATNLSPIEISAIKSEHAIHGLRLAKYKLLLQKYEEYNKLISDENSELAVFAMIHKWQSTRYEQGLKLRTEINELKKELE